MDTEKQTEPPSSKSAFTRATVAILGQEPDLKRLTAAFLAGTVFWATDSHTLTVIDNKTGEVVDETVSIENSAYGIIKRNLAKWKADAAIRLPE